MAESGHYPSRVFVGQDGNLYMNGAKLYATEAATAYAMTQTFDTADPTLATPGAAALVLTGTNIAAKTPSATLTDAVNTNAGTVATSLDQAQADLGTMINSLRTDVVDLASFVNSVVDALQAKGILD